MRNTQTFLTGFVLLISVLFSRSSQGASCKDVPRWFELREVVFRVVQPTEVYDVKIGLPRISDLKCDANPLEYGTDYHFTLKRSEPVRIDYYKRGESKVSRSTEMKDHLTAHSVLLAAERARTPHYWEITDEELDVTYYIYLSKENGPSYARREGNNRKLRILGYK